MKDTMISFVIFGLTSGIMLLIGIFQFRNRKRPVSFWSGERAPEPEEVTDVCAYNRKHGLMWICYGGAIFASGMVCGFLENPWICTGLLFLVMFGGMFVMVLYHYRLERRYRIKK